MVKPANVYRQNNEWSEKESEDNAEEDQKVTDLRPFEWLHKHLSDFLLCAYSERSGCEQKLSKAIRLEQINGRIDDLKQGKREPAERPAFNDRTQQMGPMLAMNTENEKPTFAVDTSVSPGHPEQTTLLLDREIPDDIPNFRNFMAPRKEGFEGPVSRRDHSRRPPHPAEFNRERPFEGRNVLGATHGRRPDSFAPRPMHDGKPWDRQVMPTFAEFPPQMPNARMGFPFMMNFH